MLTRLIWKKSIRYQLNSMCEPPLSFSSYLFHQRSLIEKDWVFELYFHSVLYHGVHARVIKSSIESKSPTSSTDIPHQKEREQKSVIPDIPHIFMWNPNAHKGRYVCFVKKIKVAMESIYLLLYRHIAKLCFITYENIFFL